MLRGAGERDEASASYSGRSVRQHEAAEDESGESTG